MQAFHFDRRQLRRAAWATLGVWLFALTAGVVNACVLTPAGPAEHSVGPLPHADLAVHDPHAGTPTAPIHGSGHDQGPAVAHHGHGGGHDYDKVACLKFCDDGSSVIAKVKPTLVDLGSSLLAVVQPWNPLAVKGSAGFGKSLAWPGSQGPPLVIRFLRLTL